MSLHHTNFTLCGVVDPFFGAFAKLRKATISLVMSVCPHGTILLPMDGFWLNLIFELFRKSVEKIQVSLKSDKNNWYFTLKVFTFMAISCLILLKMRNISNKPCRENQNTHFVSSHFFFFRNSFCSCDKAEKYGKARWRHIMAHTICMLDKQGYMHVKAYARLHIHTSI